MAILATERTARRRSPFGYYQKVSTAYLEERIMRVISETGPISPAEFSAITGTPKSTVNRWFARVEDQCRFHVWDRRYNSKGTQTPIYYFGNLPNARYRKTLTKAQRVKAYTDKMKAEQPEEWKARVKRSNKKLADRVKTDPEYAEQRRKQKAASAARYRVKKLGAPAPTKCPIPRPKAYRNIFEDQRTAA